MAAVFVIRLRSLWCTRPKQFECRKGQSPSEWHHASFHLAPGFQSRSKANCWSTKYVPTMRGPPAKQPPLAAVTLVTAQRPVRRYVGVVRRTGGQRLGGHNSNELPS